MKHLSVVPAQAGTHNLRNGDGARLMRNHKFRWLWVPAFAGTTVAFVALSVPAQAQSVAEFYRGKTLNVLIGVGAGGEYDLIGAADREAICRATCPAIRPRWRRT